MALDYRSDVTPSVDEYIDVLRRSTLAERRPVDDPELIGAALAGSDIVVTAWDAKLLVGAARAVTDFHLTCYIADLAVDEAYQRRGVGVELQRAVRALLGPRCVVKLTAAPAAADYYARVGYVRNDRAWVLGPDDPLG
jgi:GNAT superfamily N-acetyltransferase